MSIIFLEGEKVMLRPVKADDLNGPYASFINDQNGDHFTEHALFPHTEWSQEQFATIKWGSKDCVWLAVTGKDGGRHVGNVELRDIDMLHAHAWFHILIDPGEHGKGYGSEAAWLLLDHGFRRLNLHRVSLGVRADNEPAIKLYKRLGFQEEGRQPEAFLANGVRYDNLFMGLLRDDLVKI
jgi:ribosomal-protein-alanine N-acetyltransferase